MFVVTNKLGVEKQQIDWNVNTNPDGKWQRYSDNLAIFFLVMSCNLKQNVQGFCFVLFCISTVDLSFTDTTM